MTIGINPNLTAFAPGQMGASWCYPSFSSENGQDEWTKYAWYYRYRSIYQERFALSFIKPFLMQQGQVVAVRKGSVTGAMRTSDAPGFTLRVRYENDTADTVVPLDASLGQPPWVVLFDSLPPNNRFEAGDVIAARLQVPAGQEVEVFQQVIGYYQRFVPVLQQFESYLRSRGYTGRPLEIGEDVGQLDMVACASPHWGADWLGGGQTSVETIVENCAAQNAWAMKQLVQTRPVVLFLVGEASYDMFAASFGTLIERDAPIASHPADGAFTLLRLTADSAHPWNFRFSTTLDGVSYDLTTRIVITPHFSYGTNFLPQFRFSPKDWQVFTAAQPDCAHFLTTDPRFLPGVPPVMPPTPNAAANDYIAFVLKSNELRDGLLADLRQSYSTAMPDLQQRFYDPNAMMSQVLEDLYDAGALAFGSVTDSTSPVLTRTKGPCRFCVNDRWQFPAGCPYDKPQEEAFPVGFLENVAKAIIAAGQTTDLRAPEIAIW